MNPYHIQIVEETLNNNEFRKVLFTGEKSQVVVMSIAPHSEVGEELHEHVEQTLCFVEGNGIAVLNHVEYEVASGDLVVVPPNTRHNFINTTDLPLKLYTIYAPANHIDGRVHHTIEDALKDEEDEAFGDQAR
jgi:mannose-6-phosphate isomerase-like protein (cupin superfamily)